MSRRPVPEAPSRARAAGRRRSARLGVGLAVLCGLGLYCAGASSETKDPRDPKEPRDRREKRQQMDVAGSAGSAAPTGSAALFDRVDQLASGRALQPAEVSQAFGLKLTPDKSGSTPYFQVYTGAGPAEASGAAATAPTVTGAELRTPRKPERGQGSLLILEVSPALGIGQRDVKARYGDKPELSPPTPHQPPDAPVYWVYRRPWGKLSFGFARTGAQALVSVVVDATER